MDYIDIIFHKMLIWSSLIALIALGVALIYITPLFMYWFSLIISEKYPRFGLKTNSDNSKYLSDTQIIIISILLSPITLTILLVVILYVLIIEINPFKNNAKDNSSNVSKDSNDSVKAISEI